MKRSLNYITSMWNSNSNPTQQRKDLNASIQQSLDLFNSLDNCFRHARWFGCIKDDKTRWEHVDEKDKNFEDIRGDYMWGAPPKECYLTMNMVRPIHQAWIKAYKSKRRVPQEPEIWVVYPQDYNVIGKLTPDSPEIGDTPSSEREAGLFTTYNGMEGEDLAATGGDDLYWLANEPLLIWLRRRNKLATLLLSLSMIINNNSTTSINKKLQSREARSVIEQFERTEKKGKNQKLRRLVNKVLRRKLVS